MEESEENILAKETNCLQDINPKYILKALVEYGTLTEQEQYEILDYENLPQQRNELFALLKKKDAWFSSLIHVLEMDDSYPWIAKVLKSHEDDKNQVETLLKKGGVPFKPNHLVLRKTLLDQIKLALKSICQTDSRRGWVVLHGMPGIGKSILAAEALNDPELTLAYFQDGVWWLSVGKSATEGALFNKLQNLYERITKSRSENLPIQGLTLDDLSNNLKFCMTQAGLKRSLLVVDDIINENFVKYFDIGCPVLVTTTVSSLFENVSGKKEIVKIEDAFSREQGKELLASYCKTSVSELPLEADLIIKYCRGFPMELAMVGSYLARFAGKPSLNERWKCCVENYEKPGRRRNTSGDHQNLERAIELCISQLSSEIKQYFNDFVIFTEDTSIPSKVFEMLWGLSYLEVEEVMQTLEDCALVQTQKDPALDSECYTIHDMHRAYLRKNCFNIQALHRRLLEKYGLREETEEVPRLPNDGYIYYFLAYHLECAGYNHLIPLILLDLSFVMMKLRYAGPGDLLNDLSAYKNYFTQHEKEREELVTFIKGTADLLAKEDVDLLQLALCQPKTSSIYKEAMAQALATSSHWYFEWKNNPKEVLGNKLSLPVHHGPIHCAVFSPDAKYIASVGEDKKVKVMSSTLQSPPQEYPGHQLSVYCCIFSSDGGFLLTSSHDGTVKKWDICSKSIFRPTKKRNSLHQNESPSPTSFDVSVATYNHNVPVRWCALSSDDQYFVSGGDHGFAQVWRLRQTDRLYVQLSRDIEGGTINHCCFSLDSQLVATSSYPRHTVEVWDWKKATLISTLNLDIWPVRSSHFTPENKIVAVTESNISLWDPFNGNKETTYPYRGRPCSITFSKMFHNKLSVVFITSENRIILKDLQRRQILSNVRHQADMTSLDLSWQTADCPLLLCTTATGTIHVRELKLGVTSSLVEISSHFCALFHSTEGLTVASPDTDNHIQIFQGLDGEPIGKTPAEEEMVKSCCLSQDGSKLLYVTKNGLVKLATVEDLDKSEMWETKEDLVHCRFIHRDSKFVTSSSSGSLKIWNPSSGEHVDLRGHCNAIQKFTLFLNEKYLLSCGKNGRMIVWEVETGRQVMVCEGHGSHTVTSCDVTQDGTLLVSASADSTAKLWRFDPSAPVSSEPLRGEATFSIVSEVLTPIRCCCFSPSGNLLALGRDDGVIMVWRVESPRQVVLHQTLSCSSEAWVMDLGFSPDSQQLVSASDCVRWWNLDNGQMLQVFHTINPIQQLAIRPDFRLFVTVDEAGVLYILERLLPQ